jgi:endonuclease-3
MSNPNRSALINTTFKVLKEHYQPCQPPADRTLFEHLLYACCLEDARPEAADEAFAKLQQTFYDWNEVRVTTIKELAETMSSLPHPAAAAKRLKQALQHVFETHYSFDIEALKKQNLGKAIKDIEAIRGVTPFVADYVTQHGLGGHAIPLSQSILDILLVLGAVTETEAKRNRVPGLERAVPKAKGIECASLLHQFAAEFQLSPHSTKLRTLLLQIAPDAKDRLAKRLARPDQAPAAPAGSPAPEPESKHAAAKSARAPAAESAPSAEEAAKRKRAPTSEDAGRVKANPEPQADASPETTSAKASATKQLSKKKPR